jgi:hypothetical protein
MLKAGHRITGRSRYPAGVMDTYPVARRGSRTYPRPDGHPVSGSASQQEAQAIRCHQCWVPIENPAALANCWNCGSDNFHGHVY